MSEKSIHGYASGKVQGVWFRDFVKGHAQQHSVKGFANNLPDSRVEFVLQGEDSAVAQVLEQIHQGPPLSRVDAVEFEELASKTQYDGFTTA